MQMVLLTALGVGGATVIGAVLGFCFQKISHRFSDIVLSFAAGVMLAAAVLGLIVPSLDYGGDFGIIITVVGIFAGALCLNLIDGLVPHLHKLAGVEPETHAHGGQNVGKVLLFVLAIAIHNLPEGIAAGATVKQGDEIGRVGDTAVVEMADEPHLHFEVTVKGISADPLDFFSKTDVEALSKDPAVESGDGADTTAQPTDTSAPETKPNGK